MSNISDNLTHYLFEFHFTTEKIIMTCVYMLQKNLKREFTTHFEANHQVK